MTSAKDGYKSSGDVFDVFALAISEDASGADLETLSASKDESVRWAVANNHNAWASTLTHLAEDESETVWAEAARNPNTPPAVKLWLTTHYGEMSLEEFLKAVDSGD
jgi:hypothetical protein